MSAAGPAVENPPSAPVPRLLVELPSRSEVFLRNLRDVISPPHPEPLELASSPAPFWPDVFVTRSLPWSRFLQSAIYHVVAGAIVVGLSHLFAMQPTVVRQQPAFDHSQVVYYRASEYLPPIDTRSERSASPAKADPERSPQPIISVPRESDNRSQTIVAPPRIKLKHDVAMPNVVAWANQQQKPQLAIPDSPLVPAAEIRRLAPTVDSPVVTPPPDAARLERRRTSPNLQSSVVAPPPDVRAANAHATAPGLQPDLIAPPPAVDNSSTRRLGDINIGPSSVIAPAPQLPVAAQRTAPGGNVIGTMSPEVVPPPPSVAGSASVGASAAAGSRGNLIALNLHPTVSGPPDTPSGNRRGTFAATPEGHSGASGNPGSSGTSAANNGGSGVKTGTTPSSSSLPSGLYVGTPSAKTTTIAGNAAPSTPANTVNPNLIASIRPPRVSTARPMQPADATKLTEPERAIFGNRRFYSVTLNMPNLNSGGGSWVIRFAELKHESGPHDAAAAPVDLSEPMATRKVDPAYPLQLMRENVHGTVILYAVIRADGSVGNVKVLRSVDDRLDRFATEAISQWKFDPATKNGTPVDVEATFQIPFRPTRVGTNF
jgi:TonB family protein